MPRRLVVSCVMLVFLSAGPLAVAVRAQAPRVLPADKLPNDQRLAPPKDLNGYFPFQPSATKEQWQARADQLRRQLLVALGLWPMPTKTPTEAVIHGKVERDGYTVERVYLQSYPGHFVTGSLFRPVGKSGKLPGVLCPHGHWANGRFYDAGPKAIRDQIVQGAERFELSGRYPLQARCVQLARMGCVVFHYDMVGYADSKQVSFEVAHRYSKHRPQLETAENWGFFSPQAESHLQSIMGLQSYNSIRALDWFSALPDVDPARIAVTGASGGGTQTFILAAIDPRPAVAFPAVMVSTAMQGGCTCENCDYLRVETGNIEIAALFAPKPLGMTTANDWTKELVAKGLPELKQHYAMLGAKDNVMAKNLLHFDHNYNYVSRAAMYSWLNRHLKLGFEDPIVEEDFKPLSIAELTVWTEGHPAPAGGDDHERKLLKWAKEDADKQLAALTPKDAASLAKYREVVGGAISSLIGRTVAPAGMVTAEKTDEAARDDFMTYNYLIHNPQNGSELPAVFLFPKKWNKQVVIWIHEQGKAGLFGADGAALPQVQRLVKAGYSVTAVDLIYQGEFLAGGKPLTETRQVAGNRDFLGYTAGYNYSVFAQRVQDILSVISYVKHHKEQSERIHLVGLDGAGPLVAAARAQAGDVIARTAIDTAGFRFAALTRYTDPSFLPGGAKYGDLPGIVSLIAPGELLLAGEGPQLPPLVTAAYHSAGVADKATLYTGQEDGEDQAVVDWLLK